VADTIEELEPPTEEELRLLNEEIDPYGEIVGKNLARHGLAED